MAGKALEEGPRPAKERLAPQESRDQLEQSPEKMTRSAPQPRGANLAWVRVAVNDDLPSRHLAKRPGKVSRGIRLRAQLSGWTPGPTATGWLWEAA